jgi:DNA-binding protein HU-beta
MLRPSAQKPRRQDEATMARFTAPPEVQQEMEQMLDGHWRTWVDMKLPALGDHTPMEAVQEADGRDMVMALLDDMEQREQSQVSGLKQQKYIERARAVLHDAPGPHPGAALSTVDGPTHQRCEGMRKAELVRRIAESTELTHVKAEEVVDTILEEIKNALQQGDAVILRRFGSFQVREKRARMGRNLKTGQEAAIPARRVVRFKSGNGLKDAVNGSTSEPAEHLI